ncbi:MAG: ATP-grasp domain-containing protein [Paenibacillaceae bacterium]
MKPFIRILLTGVGSPAAPGVIRSLRLSKEIDFYVVGMDCNPDAVGFHMVDLHFIGPRASVDGFMLFVQKVCVEEKIDLILSLVTDELIKLSEAEQELLMLGTRLLISPTNSLKKVINKGELYKELRTIGIPVPNFRIVRTSDRLIKAIYHLGYPHRPVCFKPTVSDGSRGFHILNNDIDKFRMMFTEKPNSAHMSEEELLRIIDEKIEIPETIVMEFLPFEEFSVDLLVNRGKVVVAVPRLREATVNGISTKCVITEEQDIIDYAVMVVEKLQLHGNIGVQVRRDRNRTPRIVEINPRIQGTIVLCTAAGINLPVLAVKQALGIAPNKGELNIKWGTRMTRYWEEVFYDAYGSSYTL